MTVSSGFFNSLNGDRKYNAEQMSSLFDGIIVDGVLSYIGQKFNITPSSGMNVIVGTGKAWFNHCWIFNDAPYIQSIAQSEMLLNRIDAIVFDIDFTDPVRQGQILYIKGEPSRTPTIPNMIKSEKHNQYLLASIRVNSEASSITTSDITNYVGREACPFSTSPLKSIDVGYLYSDWNSKWNDWYKGKQSEYSSWYNDFTGTATSQMVDWTQQTKTDFEQWYNSLQVILEGDAAANLANEIVNIKASLKPISVEDIDGIFL